MQNNMPTDNTELLNNVNETLKLLEAYWRPRPWLRLGQIVSNAWQISPDYRRNPEPEIQDVFYLTDENFRKGLRLLVDNESKDPRAT